MIQLTFLDAFYHRDLSGGSINLLVTGNDPIIRDAILQKTLTQSKMSNQMVIVLDDSDGLIFNLSVATQMGFSVRNGMSEDCCLFDIFPINVKRKWLQLRKILGALGYTEEQKAKLVSYLDFVSYFEQIMCGDTSGDISLEVLGEYSSNIQVGMRIQSLLSKSVIDDFQKEYLLSKYSEVCSAGADFEHRLLLLDPLIRGEKFLFKPNEIISYPIAEFDGDVTVKKIIITLILEFIRENHNEHFTVLVFDKGYGERSCLVDFLKGLPSNIEFNFFSEDVFTLSSQSDLNMIFNRLPMRIYSRHSSEASCEAVEVECGEIDVTKTTYAVTYDRRWKLNRPIDVLMGNNKQEVYTTGAPIREPRYRKEMIAGFPPGTGIAEYLGQTLLFSI